MKLNKKRLIIKILSFFLLTNLVSSCSETTFLVNSAKRIGTWGDDPIYKVGNPYKINGKWYYPAIDYNYEEIGMASWYGPGFHGKKTANGEIFDQNKITAAHRTLPMPSIVKVTNLNNGKVLQKVRINDRGPFANNRILDLSKKAAEELGFVNMGTTKVKVEILEDESREYAVENSTVEVIKAESAKIKGIEKKNLSEDAKSSDSNKINSETALNNNEEPSKSLNDNHLLKDKTLVIQVGAFTDHRNAKSLIDKLSEFKAYIERTFINQKYLYRVRIGPMNNIDLANKVKEKLFKLGYTASHLIVN